MMDWTAVVPLKQSVAVKSRLGAVLSASARTRLVKAMALHVLETLGEVQEIAQVVLLTSRCPAWWSGAWADDRGATLNAALDHWRTGFGKAPVLVIHGDLPYVTRDDVGALLSAATQSGAAIAPDTHGTGTNAIALADGRDFAFRFGRNSRAAHMAGSPLVCIDRPGLARDIDLPADLAALMQAGSAG